MTSKKIWLIIVMFILLVSSVTAIQDTLVLQDSDTELMDDSYVDLINSATNYGSSTQLLVQNTQYSILKFNLSELTLGRSVTDILEANLTIRFSSETLEAGEWIAYGIYHVYEFPTYNISDLPWNEGVINYNNKPSSGSNYNVSRYDEDNISDGESAGFKTFNITDMLIQAYNNGDENLSILVRGYDENTDNSGDNLIFSSKELGNPSYNSKVEIFFDYNNIPVVEDYDTYPDVPQPNNDVKFNITCTDSDSITSYLQIYNDSVPYLSVQSQVVSNNTETTIYTLSSSLITTGETWIGEYWCGDGTSNSTKQNDSVTITNPIINFVTINNSYTSDTTPSLNFNVSSTSDTTFNCSLYVDSVLKSTVNNIVNDTNTNIVSTTLSQGTREYYVSCVYSGSNTITSLNQNIIVDTTTPSITLSSPTNDYIETTDSTPDFSFRVLEDINTTTTCELLIGGVGYGVNTSVLNNTVTTITSNSSLTDSNYQWRVSCTDQFYTGYSLYRTLIVNLNNPNINITFYDQDTGLIVDTTNITLGIITDYYSANYTTEVGWINVTLIEDVVNTIRYSATGYNERFYFVTPTNDSSYPLSLYMISDSDAYNVTVTVVDQNSDAVEDAYVKALKYDVVLNSYLLQEIGKTNFLGQTILSLTYNDEYYKFIVEYDGSTLTTTSPLYIQSSTYTIQVIIGDIIGEDYYHYEDLDYNLTYNNVTNNFRLDYNDVSGLIDQVCVYVYNTTLTSKTLINSTCLGVASGSILTGIPVVNNTSYEAKAYYTKDGKTSYLTSRSVAFTTDPDFLNYGLFLQIIITTTFALMSLWKLEISAIITPLSLILGRMIGLTSFPYEILIPLLVVGIILAMIAGNRK